jgi:hypothetical protein
MLLPDPERCADGGEEEQPSRDGCFAPSLLS